MKRLCFLLIALVAVCAPAVADFPLALLQTIQLPANTAWDVGHWMTDSTFGWACASGTTIHWVTELGTAMHDFTLPNNAQYNLPYSSVSRIKLLRTSAGGNSPLVVVVAVIPISGPSSPTSLYLSVYNLTSHTVVQEQELAFDLHDWDQDQESQVSDLVIWPPPPANGQITWTMSSTSVRGPIGVCDYTYTRIARAHTQPFARFDGQSFASARYEFTRSQYDFQSPCPPSSQTETQRISADSLGLDLCVSGRPCDDNADVIAQVDASGTRRVIIPGSCAYDAITFAQLWVDSSETFLFSAKVAGSPDERLFSYVPASHRMVVWEAAGGTFIGVTDTISGTPVCPLKAASRAAEIVTIEGTTARVYGAAAPNNFTVEYFPPEYHYPYWTPARLQLHWSPIAASNVTYRVYSDTLRNGSFSTLVGATADTLLSSTTFSPWRQFYIVKAATP